MGHSLADGQRYWNAAAASLLHTQAQWLWRAHSDAVNATVLERWLDGETAGSLLKTDSFDEALGRGLFSLLAKKARRVAVVDVAFPFLEAAQDRCPGLLAVGGDVRRLPFSDGAFVVVVSNSTLDHFGALQDLAASLRETHRVLRQGGRLLLTMDNPANPLVALRNALPFGLLHWLGLVPYYVGATCGPRRLKRLLGEAGFEVLESVALMHCPRVAAVAMARVVQRRASAEGHARFLRALMWFERLSKWPTRFLTGHFVGVNARKL
ncbi:MAG: methyltransferase domain-containing protein [Verrucomicrobia bacterium]|nr:methyltransferase domain-containing protein [Verrucomicrobiota bacterium]